MQLIVVTGLSGAGKTTYSQSLELPVLTYDVVYSYAAKALNMKKVEQFIGAHKDAKQLVLDAFNDDLLKLFDGYGYEISMLFIYTDLDDNYEVLARGSPPRDFGVDRYDDYLVSMQHSISNLLTKCVESGYPLTFIHRSGSIYTRHPTSKHLEGLLAQTKTNRLLTFINKTSGDKFYQSIVLDGAMIRKGKERDWLTCEKIQRCTPLAGKVVLDTGCFNGYFSFQALALGASRVIGADHNHAAIQICDKLCVYNHHHTYRLGKPTHDPSKIQFIETKIGQDPLFEHPVLKGVKVDIIFAFNYLHHLIRELGQVVFEKVLDSFFAHTKEILFEVNGAEIPTIQTFALKHGFDLKTSIPSHRKTSFGNRSILHFVHS